MGVWNGGVDFRRGHCGRVRVAAKVGLLVAGHLVVGHLHSEVVDELLRGIGLEGMSFTGDGQGAVAPPSSANSHRSISSQNPRGFNSGM